MLGRVGRSIGLRIPRQRIDKHVFRRAAATLAIAIGGGIAYSAQEINRSTHYALCFEQSQLANQVEPLGSIDRASRASSCDSNDEAPDVDLSWMTHPDQANRLVVEQINANSECEDRALVSPIQTPKNGTVLLAAVIDGHGGWQVAEFVQRKLAGFVQQEIIQTTSIKNSALSEQEFGESLKRAFERLDMTMANKIRGPCSMKFSRTAKVGACCVAVLITPEWLIAANVGDCRAILARGGSALPLSFPHSANVTTERERMKSLHAGETDVVVCKRSYEVHRVPRSWTEYPIHWLGLLGKDIEHSECYVKGRLQPTRSFGDFFLKAEEFSYDYESKRPFLQNAKSFPYITATPELQFVRRDAKRDKFLLLASDGVWDFLSPDQAIRAAEAKFSTSFPSCAASVIDATLEKAAAESGLSKSELLALPNGRKRHVYDDTTVCIVNLEQPEL